MLKAIIVGFFIAVFAWFIINTILGSLVEGGFGYNPLTEDFPACKSAEQLYEAEILRQPN